MMPSIQDSLDTGWKWRLTAGQQWLYENGWPMTVSVALSLDLTFNSHNQKCKSALNPPFLLYIARCTPSYDTLLVRFFQRTSRGVDNFFDVGELSSFTCTKRPCLLYDTSHVHVICIANSIPLLFNETPAESHFLSDSHNIALFVKIWEWGVCFSPLSSPVNHTFDFSIPWESLIYSCYT